MIFFFLALGWILEVCSNVGPINWEKKSLTQRKAFDFTACLIFSSLTNVLCLGLPRSSSPGTELLLSYVVSSGPMPRIGVPDSAALASTPKGTDVL